MLNELEEFLRRAAQRALEAQQKQAGYGPPPPRTPPAPPAKPIPRLVPQSEVVEAELMELPNRVEQSVQQSMRGSQQMAQHASQLGERVAQADDAIDARLHQSFDHQLGRLHKTAGGPTSQVAPSVNAGSAGAAVSGEALVTMLSSPLSIRQAILLREILDRPVDRWDS